MTPTQYQRVKLLYLELEEISPAERGARLASECADDPAVRDCVSRLLARDASDDQLLSQVTQTIERVLASPIDPLAEVVGQRIGAYDVEGILGQGGMGVVYRARDTRLDRPAALKAILPQSSDRDGYLARFRREARVLASLSHPNIATVFGLEESHGTLFLAMEFIEGKTLAERVGRHALPIERSLQICEQIAAGIEAAHDAGIIHRDLKPANIMLTGDGAIKVLDFGLAREVSLAGEQTDLPLSLTRRGSPVGTPAYMSPEQARGEPLDARSDIFSFGAVLYKCLTGRSPFSGETLPEVKDAVLARDPDPSILPANLAPSVRAILNRCLAKRPADRYRHIGDVRLDLRDALNARQWERRKSESTPKERFLRALPWAATILLALATAALLIFRPARSADPGALAQRFDVALPEGAPQRDLERLQLALSPDGREIVVACKTDTGQALWVRSHSDGVWRQIEQSEGGHRPFFSPDGQWIGFFRAGHLYKMRPRGKGDPIHLSAVTNWYGASWSDDGSLIYGDAWGDPLQKLPVQLSAAKPCTRLDADQNEVSHISPIVTPGGRWVLYNSWKGGEDCEIHATRLATGEEHVILANASSPRLTTTPRGDHLLFERASTIFAAPFDPETATLKGHESAIAEGVMNDGTRFAAYFDVAADGTLVYFPGSAFAEESRLAYVNGDGTTTPLNDERLSFCEPVFSPGGKKLAVSIKGKVYRSLVYDLERQTREFILTGGDTDSHAISPDGQTFAATVNRDGGYGIDLISLVDGRRLRRIVPPGADYQSDLAWSPDGKFIAFSMSQHEGTARDVWVVELTEGAKPRLMVSTQGADTKPAISRDSRWLAYASDVSGRSEIYLISLDDALTTRQISSSGGASPAWSPDGEKLYFIAPGGLASVNISPAGTITGKPAIIYDKPFGQSDPIARDYAIAPDGRPLIVEPSERRPTVSNLHVITNWYQLLP